MSQTPVDKLRKDIDSAIARIEELFIEQCWHGSQARSLLPRATACGQFIGSDAHAIEQRGLHGTAAALSVLAGSSGGTAAELVKLLVNYLTDWEKIERTSPPSEDLEADAQNVIKIAEVVLALKQVKPAICDANSAIRVHLERLLKARKPAGGWSYYTDDAQERPLELVPTAYATRALAAVGVDVKHELEILLTAAGSTPEKVGGNQRVETAVRILCAYVVGLGANDEVLLRHAPMLREVAGSLWRSVEPLMYEDIEQNIEYWRRGKTSYVRIPWQLYLIILVATFRFRYLASRACRARLSFIVAKVLGGGFQYPHSGSSLSSRTHAALHETLRTLRSRLRAPSFHYWGVTVFDTARDWLSSRIVSILGLISALAFAAYSVADWYQTKPSVGDLAPHLIAPAIIALLSLRKHR